MMVFHCRHVLPCQRKKATKEKFDNFMVRYLRQCIVFDNCVKINLNRSFYSV